MAEETGCTHDCSTCSANCSSREQQAPTFEAPHAGSKIKRVIGIVSGKGGVGKSIVTSMLSVIMQRRGLKTAILDADITGPSIPKAFGVKGQVYTVGDGLMPLESTTGIKVMSLNLLLEEETRPVVWRGPVIAGAVKQFWTDVIWEDVDYMFVDMPPGTGDVPLTVFQSIPLDGIVVVTTPQDLVSMIVENMAYVECPDCGKKINIFGGTERDNIDGCPIIGRLPLDPKLAALCDKGIIELMENDYLDAAADKIEAASEK